MGFAGRRGVRRMAVTSALEKLRRRPGSALALQGLATVGGTAILQETLFATGGRESRLIGAIATEASVNTAAGTHDGSDVTRDGFYLDNTAGLNPAEDIYEVIYDFQPATFAGTISFVRGLVRVWLDSGNASLADIEITTAQAGFVASAYSPLPATDYTITPTTYTITMFVDPLDGLPWTAAKINVRKKGFGARMVIPALMDDLSNISEITFQVWGF